MADTVFPDDISKWVKGRIREKDSDSSHYDDFYRYGNFGIEHDANGMWEAYTIVDEKPILARDGLGSFDEAVEFFKDEMRHKALKDSESHEENEDCKIADESPEPPSYPEEESSGMRLEIFLKSAEDMLSEYQGFTKASNVKDGQYYAHGDAYRQAQKALADAYRKQFSNVKGFDLKALSNVLDSFGSEDGGDVGTQKRSNRLQTLKYMDDTYPEPARYYRHLNQALRNSKIPVGEMTNARPYRFLDDDDLKSIKAKYGDSKDKWIQKMSSRDFDLDDISDRNTLNYVNNLMAGGFNVNRGYQSDMGRPKDYLYEQYPVISEFLPEVVDGKLTGNPVNPFIPVRYREPRKGKELTDEEKKKIKDDAKNLSTYKYKDGTEKFVPERYDEKLSRLNGKNYKGHQKSVSYLKKINDAGDTDVLFTINPRLFAYHAPVNDMIANRAADPTHTSMYATPWVRAEEYGEKSDDVNENIKRMVQDPEIYSLLNAYYMIKGNTGNHKASIASAKEAMDKDAERLKETPVEDDIEKKYNLAKKMVDDWEHHFDKHPEDKNDARQNELYEKAKAELKAIKYRHDIKQAYDAAKEEYDSRTYASKANDKLFENVYRELYRKSNEFLKRTAPMKVWYDIMANGAQYTDEAGTTHALPIKYIPPNMSELSFKEGIHAGEGKGNLDDAVDPYTGVKSYTIPFSQLPDRDDVINKLMRDSADYISNHPVEAETEPEPEYDDRKDVKTLKDIQLMNLMENHQHKEGRVKNKVTGVTSEGKHVDYDPKTGKYTFPDNRQKDMKGPETEVKVEAETKVDEEKPKTEKKPKTDGKKGTKMKAEKTEEKTEKPKTEKTEKSATIERSAEDIFNEWSSGETHLIRDPWKTLVLDAGAKESDPLTIHDDSGNILFDLRHQ